MKTIKIFLLSFSLFVLGAVIVNATTVIDDIIITVTPVAPTVDTPTDASPTTTGATLGANVASLGVPAAISARGTCWGTTTNPTTNCAAASGTTTGAFTHARTGMTCGTTYYYRGYATNTTGTGYSASGTVTTSVCPVAPTVTTPTVTSITTSGATLGANVTSLGVPAAISARGTCWGTTTNPTTNCVATTGTTTGVFTHARTGLSPGTTYYYRGYATNTTGTGYSASASFTTASANVAPTVTTPTSTSITTSGATLGANVTSLGYPAAISARGTCWGTTTSPTTNCAAATGTTTGVFSHSRTGMSCGTTYYYRGYATNTTGTGYSTTSTVATSACPIMSGSISSSASSCTIASGSGSCNVTITWSTTNPVATSAVTASGMTSVNGNSGSQAMAVPYSSRTFYLYNNGDELDSVSVTSSCTSGTTWNGSTCAANVAPTVTTPTDTSPTTTGATLGANVTNAGVPSTLTARGTCWGTTTNPTTNCAAASGTTTGVFSHARTGMSACTTYYYRGYANNATGRGYSPSGTVTTACVMSGSISSSASSCTIASGASSCNVTITWSTTNPVATSSVTASGMTTVNGNSGSQAMAVPYSSRTFYLYNNSVQLDSVSVTSSCASGTTWNGTTCATNTYTVTGTAGANGTISPATRTVNHGSTTTFTVTPNSGYSTSSATGCSGSRSGTTYTTGAITSACTVTVAFSATPVNGVCSDPDVHYDCDAGTSTNNVSGATTWTWSCAGVNGGTTAACSEAKVMSGTITASNCTISSGASNCNSSLNWSTTNPVATSSVTTPTSITVGTGNSGSTTYAVSGSGARTFYLYNNGVLLNQDAATATCTSGTTWNGSTCAPNACANGATNPPTCTTCVAGSVIIESMCTPVTVTTTASPTTYNTTVGSSVSFAHTADTNSGVAECRLLDNTQAALTSYQATSPISYTIPSTAGSYGYYVQCRNTTTTSAIDNSDLITVNVTTGNVVPTVTTPTVTSITTGGATLGANVTSLGTPAAISARGTCWGTTTNPTTNCTAASGTTTGVFTHARTGMQPGTLYYYRGYANNTTGRGYSPTSSFTTVGAMLGTLTVGGCSIAEGDSSCTSTLDWSTSNPVATSNVRTPNATGTIIATSNGGSTTSVVSYPSKIFVLENNGVTLDTKTAIAACIFGTGWSGTECVSSAPMTTFAANPASIFKGGSSTLVWNSTADSCVSTGEGFDVAGAISGSIVVSPLVTTTYTLQCTNVAGTTENSIITKVITLKIEEN